MSNEVCAICEGPESDHAFSKHVYTTNPGELITKEQKDKEQPAKRLPLPHPTNHPMGRLLEVLVVKGMLTIPEVLYISDLGDRPESLGGVSNGNGS